MMGTRRTLPHPGRKLQNRPRSVPKASNGPRTGDSKGGGGGGASGSSGPGRAPTRAQVPKQEGQEQRPPGRPASASEEKRGPGTRPLAQVSKLDPLWGGGGGGGGRRPLGVPAGSVWGEIGEIQVDISGSSVTLTCPAEEASWRHGKVEGIENPLSLSDNLEKGQMATCKAGQSTRAVYVKVKACEDCVELGLGLVAAIITSDLLITLGVLCMVYFGCKNHAATFHGRVGGAGTHGQPRDQKVDHPPPVPNPDYEPIRKGQREVYAGLGARAF
ncbi:T-cell surface glycoprotein CD3 epsilon chain isoform X3 [Sceloporus undulatus]|uniref:T-cell surface glycoprotein CD3 epsilon chain isoform X3 n=1 Tax=Sceloporus undulatus TaxID=8520 RepID=UPI001C4B8A55|nr:T-cell surface glycoprotein CD3 epsilon chain isoform X3 [Sceloporus undulatus]